MYFLNPTDMQALSDYLARQKWISSDEVLISLLKAGEGNMNCTLRVQTNKRSFIAKQGRAWVEKYPHIAAPKDRTEIEFQFYRAIAGTSVELMMPKVMAYDDNARILLLEDLGSSAKTFLESRLRIEDITSLSYYLSQLHRLKSKILNEEMKALNHEHIFRYPLVPNNGLDLDALTPGLQAIADVLKADQKYVQTVSHLGEIYLHGNSEKSVLLHGDFYPGSWMHTHEGLRVIDPEFCLMGPPEFDLGVTIAHFILNAYSAENTEMLLREYKSNGELNRTLLLQFAGIEIMRRLIGVAQLPIIIDPKRKFELLKLSRQMVLTTEFSYKPLRSLLDAIPTS